MSMRKVRDLLQELATSSQLEPHVYRGLTDGQIDQLAARDFLTYTGKVRDVVRCGDELLIVHSDRLTAFDKLIGLVPYKGTILTEISAYWLEEAKKVVPTHLISRPHERVLRVERAEPFKVEVIVRGHLAGSMQRAYMNGERSFCGATLPEGLKPYSQLPTPIITPTTKAAAFEHDENTTPEAILRQKICTAKEWQEITTMAFALFAHGQKVYGKIGWLLVDTKYEFGRTVEGAIKVIDEIHTPDSSRLWNSASYAACLAAGRAPDMLDKENVRRYLLEQGFSGEGVVPKVPVAKLLELAQVYLQVAETLTGRPAYTAGPDQVIDVAGLVT